MRRYTFIILVLGLMSFCSLKAETYALVIGISKFDNPGFDSLQFSGSDAQHFYDFLQKGYIQGLRPENIKLLIDARYSVVEDLISNWLMGLRRMIKPGDNIYIYWSGHGVITDLDQSLLCRDSELREDNYTGAGLLTAEIGIKTIKTAISFFAARAGVKVFLIVDACRLKIKGLSSIPGPVLEITQVPSGDGDVYLYSCSSGGPSFETALLPPGNGVFTYFLLLGLEGAADGNRNGEVSVGEIETFLHDYVNKYVTLVLRQEDQVPYIVLKNNPDRRYPITQGISRSVADRNKVIADSMRKLIQEAAENGLGQSGAEKGIRYGGVRPVDSADVYYDSMLHAISRNELVIPRGRAAYDYFGMLKQWRHDSLYIDNARRKLVIALVDKVKDLIGAYLDGTLPTTKKEVFDLGFEELSRCIELRPPGDPFTMDFIPKLEFLKARALAGSNKPTDWAQGLMIIDSALQKNRTAYMYHTKGMLYSNKGRYFSATRYFDTAIMYAPNWTYALYNRAIEQLRVQEVDECIRNCKDIIRRRPGFSKAYSLLGSAYETLNNYRNVDNYDKAITSNKKALELDSTNGAAFTNLGRIYSRILTNRLQYLDSSIKYYRLGADKLSDENCLYNVGIYYMNTIPIQLDSSRFYFKRSLDVNPFNTNTLYNYAVLLRFTNDSAGADALYENAIKSSSYDYRILCGYRNFSFTYKSPEFADLVYRQTVDSNHEDPNIFLDHSKQFERIDSLLVAREVLLEGLRYIDSSPSLNFALGSLYLRHSKNPRIGSYPLDSAQFYFNRVREVAPDYSLINSSIAKLYELKGEKDSILVYSNKAKEVNQFSPITLDFTADLLLKGFKELNLKNYKEAVFNFKQAYALNENQYASGIQLSRSFYLAGSLDSARKYYYLAVQHPNGSSATIDSTLPDKDELRALIEFDDNKFRNALFIFDELERIKQSPHHLGKLVTLFKLNDKNALLQQTRGRDTTAISKAYCAMKSRKGTVYSSHFIDELTKTYNFMIASQKKPRLLAL